MVLLELSLYPLGTGQSVGDYVARCLRIVEASGLDYQCHAMGTTMEGELHQVMDVARRCIADLMTDCDRVECMMKIDYRKGYQGELASRMTRVEQRLGHTVRK